jgi:hypothetical protein
LGSGGSLELRASSECRGGFSQPARLVMSHELQDASFGKGRRL